LVELAGACAEAGAGAAVDVDRVGGERAREVRAPGGDASILCDLCPRAPVRGEHPEVVLLAALRLAEEDRDLAELIAGGAVTASLPGPQPARPERGAAPGPGAPALREREEIAALRVVARAGEHVEAVERRVVIHRDDVAGRSLAFDGKRGPRFRARREGE